MAGIDRNSLVLTGVCVDRDVVTGTMGFGLNRAFAQFPAMPFPNWDLSQYHVTAEPKPVTCPIPVDALDMDKDADRAGRPGLSDGVLASQGPALAAGQSRQSQRFSWPR